MIEKMEKRIDSLL